MNKKFIFSLIVAVVCGAFIGHTLFEKFRKEEETVFSESTTLYFLREGVYDNLEYALTSANKYDTKIIVKEKAKYYLYLAISRNEETLDDFKKIYKNIEDNKKETVIGLILANYEELVLKN